MGSWSNNNNNNGELGGGEYQQQQQQQDDDGNGNGNGNVNVNVNGNGNGEEGGIIVIKYAKVMTDEQLETLREQIAVYASICDQLVQMHKTISAQQDHHLISGGRPGNIYTDSYNIITSAATPKFTSRQRWTPTAAQLHNLERIFEQGSGTPTKHKIKEITSQLSQHGQISETNVYNWFQNRRARSKRKQVLNNGESEVDTEVDSSNENNITKPEVFLPQQNQAPGDDHLYFHAPPEITPDMHYLEMLSNHNEALSGKMGVPGSSYNLYDQADDYGMAG
ncbi:hypothetical protein ACFE04_015564 [Oxalis oulophora]